VRAATDLSTVAPVRAAVFYESGPPSVLVYEDVADPDCGPGMVLVRVEAISLEGGDVLGRATMPVVSAPHIVGYQCAGTIVGVGEGVTDREVGQRVAAFMWAGSHAELAATRAQFTWPVPAGLDTVTAACVPAAFGTAHDCLFEFGNLRAEETEATVLVQAGAGGVGIATIQLAARVGATVIATASSPARLEPLHELGMDVGVDYSRDDWVDRVRAVTDGRGVDLVVDSVGGHILQGSLACMAYRGRCITVGQASREGRTIDVTSMVRGNQSLHGVLLGAEMDTERVHTMIATLLDDVASGELQVVVDREYPLADAAAAHAYVESRQAVGRVVLVP
jgi:NADPH:quinone reductase